MSNVKVDVSVHLDDAGHPVCSVRYGDQSVTITFLPDDILTDVHGKTA